MTIEQANAVMVVLRAMLQTHQEMLDDGWTVERSEREIEAAALLADKAHAKLMAGLTGDEVREQLERVAS